MGMRCHTPRVKSTVDKITELYIERMIVNREYSMRHISFDFWNTVGKPNSVYAKERTKFLAEVFDTTPEIAKATYTRTKRFLDQSAEERGVDHGRRFNLLALCTNFYDTLRTRHALDDGLVPVLANGFDDLFAQFPPSIDPLLVEQLHRAHAMEITLSIGSNTNFIVGRTILQHCFGGLPFDFYVFSDEIECSKPSPDFFTKVFDEAFVCNPTVETRYDITHIGDNKICDSEGARAAQMRFAHVDDADATAAVLKQLLDNTK